LNDEEVIELYQKVRAGIKIADFNLRIQSGTITPPLEPKWKVSMGVMMTHTNS